MRGMSGGYVARARVSLWEWGGLAPYPCAVQPASRGFLKLAPDVPGLEALGASTLDDLFADPPRTVTSGRARRLGESWIVPLPGTPDEHGRQHEKPRGAGTGLLYVRRFAPGGVAGVRARFTRPRSSSLAARHWNVICHLQANGLAAPQLVALAERGASLLGSESVLVTRDLEGFVPLRTFLETVDRRVERRRALHSLALALVQLARCGAGLPSTTLDNLRVQRDDEDCVALKIVNLQSEQSLLRERELARTRLPAIAFTSFSGARLGRRPDARELDSLLVALAGAAGPLLSRRERLELLVRLGFTRAAAALAVRCDR